MASSPPTTSPAGPRAGVLRKPFIEKLKLVALFALIGALIYFSTPTRTTFIVGTVLVALGTIVRIWAGGHLTRDQRLTTSGPYQYTRNPFYLGRFLLIIGFAIMSGLGNVYLQMIVIVSLIIFFAFYMPRKERREGGRLRQLFGEDYERWKANVPELFPRLTPYVMNPKPWSRELFMGGDSQFTGNKELWTTIAIILLVGAFYWRMQNPLQQNTDNATQPTTISQRI